MNQCDKAKFWPVKALACRCKVSVTKPVLFITFNVVEPKLLTEEQRMKIMDILATPATRQSIELAKTLKHDGVTTFHLKYKDPNIRTKAQATSSRNAYDTGRGDDDEVQGSGGAQCQAM